MKRILLVLATITLCQHIHSAADEQHERPYTLTPFFVGYQPDQLPEISTGEITYEADSRARMLADFSRPQIETHIAHAMIYGTTPERRAALIESFKTNRDFMKDTFPQPSPSTLFKEFLTQLPIEELETTTFDSLPKPTIGIIDVVPENLNGKVMTIDCLSCTPEDTVGHEDNTGYALTGLYKGALTPTFLFFTNEGKTFAQPFLQRLNIQEMLRRGLTDTVMLALDKHAQENNVTTCGVVFTPNKTTIK